MANIYLDYAATSRKHFDIIEKNMNILKEVYANPSSSHTLGKKNDRLVREGREKIAKTLNASSNEIIFNSGGTESNNTVFNHVLTRFETGEIIISSIEHPSVKASAKRLERFGFKVHELSVDESGAISIDELKEKINPKTVLISIMLANNETGVLNPIKEVSELIADKNILLHSDIVQALGKVEIDVKELGLDFASASAHKLGSLNNFGFLYAKDEDVEPLLLGGGQENGLRSGTKDLLGTNGVEFEVNGSIENSLPNILNIYFKNVEAQRLITYLDARDIYISGGSACSSGNIKGSRIITEMYNIERAAHSVRISVGFDTSRELIDEAIEKRVTLEKRIKERN